MNLNKDQNQLVEVKFVNVIIIIINLMAYANGVMA